MNFNFGQPKTTANNNPLIPGTSQTSTSGFPSLGTQPQTGGFSLGTINQNTPPKTGTTTTGISNIFNFPTGNAIPVTVTTASNVASTSLSSLLPKPTVPTPSSFPFKATTTAPGIGVSSVSTATTAGFGPGTTTPAGTLTFGSSTTTTAGPLSFGSSTTTTAGPLTFGSSTTTTAGPLTFGSNTTTTAGPLTFGSSTTTTAGPLTFGSSTTTTTAMGLSSALTLSATTVSTALGAKPATTQAGSTTPQAQSMSFQELEEVILNKWTSELIEQEKVFLNQANQINTWDKIINDNTEKLKQLHSTMEKVRKQQTKINDDLDVISTHQKDLENCLVPMEKENFPLPAHKTDPNRKNLYMNATNIDSQIKRMSEDLKETIEQINETSRLHDNEDPVIQIGRILNAHMESLKWIDEHTSKMQDYLDSLLKVHDNMRRECDILNKIEGY